MKDRIAEGIIKGFSVQDIINGIKAGEYDDIEKYLKQNELIKLWEKENQKEFDIMVLAEFVKDLLNIGNRRNIDDYF